MSTADTSQALTAQVKQVLAVASGKGGVGKSATAVNLALALAAEGARVGLLDADIYSPSQPLMLGIAETQRPETREQKYFLPIEAHGLQTMSIGYLVTEKTPMVWRGPMASGALTQMIKQTLWRDLDYLVVDMPPGTGDIQLTLSQQVAVSAAVIVTTPQDISLLDARKGIEMFRKVDIPSIGIVENMAMHTCTNCGHTEHIFGSGGGERMAAEYDVDYLGGLPLDIRIREQADSGKPTVVADPDGELAGIYKQIARRLAVKIADVLRGRHKPIYTPHLDTGDFVVVINAEKVRLTGRKEEQKIYQDYSGYMSGLKEKTAAEIRRRRPERLIEDAVWGMLPHGRLGRAQYRKLKVYKGSEHPHQAQSPEPLEI